MAILSFVDLEEHSFNAIKYTEQTRVFYDVLQVLYVISTVQFIYMVFTFFFTNKMRAYFIDPVKL